MRRRLIAAGAGGAAVLAATAAAAVAAERVTIQASPAVVSSRQTTTTLAGSLDSAKAGQVVTIQAKECGQRLFWAVASATSREGGAWSTQYRPRITTILRAVWNEHASAQVTVWARPAVVIKQRPGSTFLVGVGANAQFWRKRVLIQRFDLRLGTWTTLKSVVLTETVGGAGGIWSSTRFKAPVPKGSLVRAVLPLAQARPCYLAGYSNMLRT